jgi:hypothetical protein
MESRSGFLVALLAALFFLPWDATAPAHGGAPPAATIATEADAPPVVDGPVSALRALGSCSVATFVPIPTTPVGGGIVFINFDCLAHVLEELFDKTSP